MWWGDIVISLVLEGGSFRGLFTAGVLDALGESGINIPYIVGVSAGISNAASYASGQYGRNLEIMRKYRNDPRYTGLANILKDHSIFGIEFVFEKIPNELVLFDYKKFNDYPGVFLVGATNAETGKIEYFNCKEFDKTNKPFKATCSIPGLFPPQIINNQKYFDGGVACSIPILKAIEDGCDKHIIVLTQPSSFKKRLDTKTKLAIKRVEKEYPNIAKDLKIRSKVYNVQKETCHKLASENKAIVLEPSFAIKSDENDVSKLEAAYFEGKRVAYENMCRILDFIKE